MNTKIHKIICFVYIFWSPNDCSNHDIINKLTVLPKNNVFVIPKS